MPDVFADTLTIGSTPGGGSGHPAPTLGMPIVVQADPTQEYVSATGAAFYGNWWRSLRWAFDDVTEEFGDDVYERMMREPQCLAVLNVVRAGILEDGPQLIPVVSDKDEDGYELSKMLVDDCEEMIEELSLDETLWDMLSAMPLGNRVAELIFDDATGRIVSIKPRPRRSVAFVVDVYNNVAGLLARIPGLGVPVQAGSYIIAGTPPYNILPREKFAVLTFRPKDNDPRGTSLYRAIYNVWWLKMQTWKEFYKFLVQFGTPSLIGYIARSANTVTLPGSDQQSPQQKMVETLIKIRNGSVAALEEGDKIEPLTIAQGGIAAFQAAFDLYDRQITIGVLNQTLATMEAQFGTRAQAGVHRDVLTTIVRQCKKSVQKMVRNDILRTYVRYRYGPTYGPAIERLTPRVTLGVVEQEDISVLWAAAAQLARANYFAPDQLPAVDELINLPPRQATDTELVGKSGAPADQQPANDGSEDGNDDTADASPSR